MVRLSQKQVEIKNVNFSQLFFSKHFNDNNNPFFILTDANPTPNRFIKVNKLTPKSKSILSKLYKIYPPGPCRDRMVYGLWVNCDKCKDKSCIY